MAFVTKQRYLNFKTRQSKLTLLRNVHKLYRYLSLGCQLLAQHHFAEASLAYDIPKFILIQNVQIVEVFPVQRQVENVVVLEELEILLQNLEPIPIVQLRGPLLFLLAKEAAGLL